MAYLLRRHGIPAAVISGETRDVTRRQVVADFKQKIIRVLCNCNVLTTGFDAPKVTHVVMARPTVSRVLYEQILGRGLRGPQFGGTETCTILDCKDNFKGERPPLGYEAFRRVWKREVSGSSPFSDGLSLEKLDEALQTSA
jgi:superfamily II DNA or RNA helicase